MGWNHQLEKLGFVLFGDVLSFLPCTMQNHHEKTPCGRILLGNDSISRAYAGHSWVIFEAWIASSSRGFSMSLWLALEHAWKFSCDLFSPVGHNLMVMTVREAYPKWWKIQVNDFIVVALIACTGRMVILHENVDVYGKLVGKYASPMDAMGSGCLRVPEVQQRVKALKEWWDWDMNSGIHNQPLIGS